MKPFLIGCGVILLLFIGGVIAAFVFLPDVIKRGMDMANEAIAAEQERQALALGWTPPTPNETADEVFPAELSTYKRTTAETGSGIPQLMITLPGQHAVYESGPSKIDAYVFAYTPQQRTMVLKQVEDLNKGQGSTSWIKVDLGDEYARTHFSSGTLGSNYLWFTKTHLVVFRTADSDDREPILKAFFTARQAAVPAAPAPTATKKAQVISDDDAKPVDPDKDPDADGKKDGAWRLKPNDLGPSLRRAA